MHFTSRIFAAMAMFACLATGCSGVLESKKPARQVYLLQPPASATTSTPTQAPAALVMSVDAIPGMDTDRIMVLGRDAQLMPVANARWADYLPEVVGSLVRRTLAETAVFGPVREGSVARPGEWLLRMELQALYGVQDSAGNTDSVKFSLEGQLTCNGSQHVIRIRETSSAAAVDIATLASAHQRVLNAGLVQLPQKITDACEPS